MDRWIPVRASESASGWLGSGGYEQSPSCVSGEHVSLTHSLTHSLSSRRNAAVSEGEPQDIPFLRSFVRGARTHTLTAHSRTRDSKEQPSEWSGVEWSGGSAPTGSDNDDSAEVVWLLQHTHTQTTAVEGWSCRDRDREKERREQFVGGGWWWLVVGGCCARRRSTPGETAHAQRGGQREQWRNQ